MAFDGMRRRGLFLLLSLLFFLCSVFFLGSALLSLLSPFQMPDPRSSLSHASSSSSSLSSLSSLSSFSSFSSLSASSSSSSSSSFSSSPSFRQLLELSQAVTFATPPAQMHPSFQRNAHVVDHVVLTGKVGEQEMGAVAKEGFLAVGVVGSMAGEGEKGMLLLKSFERQRIGSEETFLFCLSPKILQQLDLLQASSSSSSPPRRHVGVLPLRWVSFLQEAAFLVDPKPEGKIPTNPKFVQTSPHVKPAMVLRLLQLNITVLYSDLDLHVKWSIDVIRAAKHRMEVDPKAVFFATKASEQYLQRERENQGEKDQVPVDVNSYLSPFVDPRFFIVKPSSLTIRLFELISINLLRRQNLTHEQAFNEALDVLGMKTNGENSGRVRYDNLESYKLDA